MKQQHPVLPLINRQNSMKSLHTSKGNNLENFNTTNVLQVPKFYKSFIQMNKSAVKLNSTNANFNVGTQAKK